MAKSPKNKPVVKGDVVDATAPLIVIRGTAVYQEKGGDVVLNCLVRVPLASIGAVATEVEAAPLREPIQNPLHCSFCGKSQNDIFQMVAGPGVYICNECMDVCNEIVADAKSKTA